MAALWERHVLAGAVGGVVGCVPVFRGHGMPEGLPCRSESA